MKASFPETSLPRRVFALAACVLALHPDDAAAREFQVQVNSNRFTPAELRIQEGDTVRWVFADGVHSTTSGSGCSANVGWDSDVRGAGANFSRTFTAAGTYPYFCRPHCTLGMTGRITVAAAAAASPSPSASPAPGASPTPSGSPTPSPAACGETGDPLPAPIARSATPDVALRTLVGAGQGLVSPNWGMAAPGDRRHLFVTDTVGKVWAVNVADGSKNLVLDVSSLLVDDLGTPFPSAGGYDERGLLGLAFHPRYRRNGLLYLFTSEPYDAATLADFTLAGLLPGSTPDNRIVVSEWRIADPAAAQPTVAGGRRVLMTIDHPQFNHNGGALNFGADGFLYIALGDGGAANDQDTIGGRRAAVGNGQDRATVLGKILRIDPRKRTSANGQYGIPRTNPYFARGSRGGAAGCADGRCDEIWAYGFRNPYRFSFDRSNGNLLAGDVGQNELEEVDWVRKGRNYGWRHKEGSFFFNPNSGGGAFVTADNCLGTPDGLTDPIAQYDHDEGIAVVGGFVYRGRAVPSLRAQYVFGDYAGTPGGGRLFRIRAGILRGSGLRTVTELRILGEETAGMFIYGFGQDARGEIYVMGNTSGVPVPRDGNGALVESGLIRKLAAP